MTSSQPWTAPAVERTEFPMVAGERVALEGFLDWHRETLRAKCAGLTAEQLAARSVPPSSMSLLGLVRHLTEVERIWFRQRVAGEQSEPPYKTEQNWDADFDGADAAGARAALARYEEEVAAARAVTAGRGLDDTFTSRTRAGDELTFDLRWVMVHMIEEYARHNGHADLLRERIDGATGE